MGGLEDGLSIRQRLQQTDPNQKLITNLMEQHQQLPSDTPSDVLAQEISLNIHILAGTLIDQRWPMETVQEAIRKAADLLPLLESQNDGDEAIWTV